MKYKEISSEVRDICSRYKFEYQESIGYLDGYYYLFFVADGGSPKTVDGIRFIEKLGLKNYDNIGNHCYAHYYRIKL
ncbi:MAG: hypothetical protein IKT40_12560 [Bacilli bacterium]|nr:hypothetical protein [Bacilli bacterium]